MQPLKHIIKQKGFTIVEVVAAVAILGFGVVGVYGAFSVIVNSTKDISNRFIAAYLAQEGIEVMRNIRDNNFINAQPWSTLLSTGDCATACQFDYRAQTAGQIKRYDGSVLALDSDGFYVYTGGVTNTIFKRSISVAAIPGNTDVVNVTVLVTWTYKNKTSTLSTSEYLYNWY